MKIAETSNRKRFLCVHIIPNAIDSVIRSRWKLFRHVLRLDDQSLLITPCCFTSRGPMQHTFAEYSEHLSNTIKYTLIKNDIIRTINKILPLPVKALKKLEVLQHFQELAKDSKVWGGLIRFISVTEDEKSQGFGMCL